MILVCEMIFDRGAHIPFNAGLLATIRAAFPNDDLAFYGGREHLTQLKMQVGQALGKSIHWKEIRTIPPGKGYGERLLQELNVIQHLFRGIDHDITSRLILTSAFPSTVLAMKMVRLFRSKTPKVQMVLHGLSGVSGKRRRHPLYRLQDMNTALNLLGNSGIQYVVLEEAICHRVLSGLPKLSGKIGFLEHPISPIEGTTEMGNLSEPIRFGFLGTALKSKGYPLFVEVARSITARYGTRAEFHVIGRCPEESKCVRGTETLTTQPAASPLTREDFVRGVAPLHFVVLPYQVASYIFSASGVLLDAIAWQKPIIARRMPTFEAMFQKHGDIGYLFGEDSELTGIVQQIVDTADVSRYYRQVSRLREVRKSRDPETLAVSYRELCRVNEGNGGVTASA